MVIHPFSITSISYFTIFICLLILIFYALQRHNNFIDCRLIIKNHFSIFEFTNENGKKSYLKGQIFLFFILPLALSISVTVISIISDAIINVITVIMTIITSMLFTVLSMFISISKKDSIKNFNTVLKETYYSIAFEILLSVFILVFCLVYLFISGAKNYIMIFFFSVIIYYFCFTIILNLFIVLKRINVILKNIL